MERVRARETRVQLPSVTLVLGGARSGKSRFAENLVESAGCPALYLATAEVRDEEMRARIAEHRARRGSDWSTREEPLDIAPVLSEDLADDAVALVDCLTLWLANLMERDEDIAARQAGLLAALDRTRGRVVLVSNEVGLGIVPDNALARAFRDHQGRLNQAVAARADLVVFMAAGLPMTLKGRLP